MATNSYNLFTYILRILIPKKKCTHKEKPKLKANVQIALNTVVAVITWSILQATRDCFG